MAPPPGGAPPAARRGWEVRPRRALPVAALLAACALVFWVRLGSYGIFDLDEGLYVEASREMLLRGDYVTPRVNGAPFFEKPPLVYWAAAASMRLLGTSEAAARVPAALAMTLLCLLTWALGRRLLGPGVGLLGGLFLALCPLSFGAGRQLTMDALLSLWVAAAIACLAMARDAPPRAAARWLDGYWAACALGVLTKGAPGLAVPVAVAAISIALRARRGGAPFWQAARRLAAPRGILLFLLIAVPWHVAALAASGDAFVSEYVVRQHIGRFLGGDTSHRAPFWFYVPGFLLGFFPWSLLLPGALLGLRGVAPDRTDQTRKTLELLTVWVAVVFVVFSASGSKLVSYILPMYAPAALLAAWRVLCPKPARAARRALAAGLGAAALSAAGLWALTAAYWPIIAWAEARLGARIVIDEGTEALVAWAASALLLVALGTGVGCAAALAGRPRAAIGAACVGMAGFLGSAVARGLPVLDAHYLRPLHRAAAAAGEVAMRAEAPLLIDVGSPRRPSALFYLPDALIAAPGRVTEMADASAAARWANGPGARVALVSAPVARGLRARAPAMRPVALCGGFVVLESPGSSGPGAQTPAP